MSTPHQRAANAAGWFNWFGTWLHVSPWESWENYRPTHYTGTARELCLSQGILTGEPI